MFPFVVLPLTRCVRELGSMVSDQIAGMRFRDHRTGCLIDDDVAAAVVQRDRAARVHDVAACRRWWRCRRPCAPSGRALFTRFGVGVDVAEDIAEVERSAA